MRSTPHARAIRSGGYKLTRPLYVSPMGSCAFSSEQNLAVQARLNFMLGSRLYDQLFLGFQCGELKDDVLRVFARSEYLALEIAAGYSLHVAIAVESVLKRPVKSVNVLPRGLLDSESDRSARSKGQGF